MWVFPLSKMIDRIHSIQLHIDMVRHRYRMGKRLPLVYSIHLPIHRELSWSLIFEYSILQLSTRIDSFCSSLQSSLHGWNTHCTSEWKSVRIVITDLWPLDSLRVEVPSLFSGGGAVSLAPTIVQPISVSRLTKTNAVKRETLSILEETR